MCSQGSMTYDTGVLFVRKLLYFKSANVTVVYTLPGMMLCIVGVG